LFWFAGLKLETDAVIATVNDPSAAMATSGLLKIGSTVAPAIAADVPFKNCRRVIKLVVIGCLLSNVQLRILGDGDKHENTVTLKMCFP
jgi:hypothetical protein